MKITVFVKQHNYAGGKTKAMFDLATMLHQCGFDVTLCALWHTGKPVIFDLPDGVKTDYLDSHARK